MEIHSQAFSDTTCEALKRLGEPEMNCCTELLYWHDRGHLRQRKMASDLVGVAGFEPTTSSSRTKRATKLRHTPSVPSNSS